MRTSVIAHYLRPSIAKEISDWLKNRWIAFEGFHSGKRIFIRYDSRGKPLRINSVNDFTKLILRYRDRIRAVYGSINLYHRLEQELDLEVLTNIIATTPSWDIDLSLIHI